MNPFYILLIIFSSALVPYLLGSIDFAIIVCKIVAGKDIRDYGSGNAGLTNVLRVFGKGPALATLAGDFSKAVLGVLFARLMFSLWLPTTQFDGAYIGGLFVLLGHIFPLYYHFKGGKGVLTCAGIALVVNPLAFYSVFLFCIDCATHSLCVAWFYCKLTVLLFQLASLIF